MILSGLKGLYGDKGLATAFLVEADNPVYFSVEGVVFPYIYIFSVIGVRVPTEVHSVGDRSSANR